MIFGSKTLLREQYRDILHKYQVGESVASDDFQFLMSLINESQDRETLIGPGISQIVKTVHPVYKQNCFFVMRTNGTKQIIGFDRLIFSRDSEEIYNAFRFAILQQVYVYRLTHDAEERDDVHHIVPLRRLIKRFLKTNHLSLSEIKVQKHPTKPDIWVFQSDSIRDAWREFHKHECDLTLISREEHRTIRDG